MNVVTHIPTILGKLFAKSQTSSYDNPVDAAFKAMVVQ